MVVSSCGAINSAALLLRSASERHPNGLANSSDQLGRNYMAHINSGVVAVSQTVNPTTFQKTLGVNDYYWGAPDSELPLGHIQMLAKSDRNILRAGAPWFAPLARARLPRPARDRLLADDRGPASAREPGHGGSRGSRSTSRRPTPTRSRTGGCWASSRICSGRSDATRRRSRASRCSTSRSRSPASPTRAGLRASGPIPLTLCWTSTARPTTSTTSTSSTRASSRPRVR